jgi:CDP-paratose 2-epimerase
MRKLLITGSSGLIGSEAVAHFDSLGYDVVGIDNNMRAFFFGPAADTRWRRDALLAQSSRFRALEIDIRDRTAIMEVFDRERFDAVFHCAAQPSHDKAREIPAIDFEVNAVGTLNLLEANRQFSAEAPFVFMSTNKVYGDAPNEIRMKEMATRWELDEPQYRNGIPEQFRIDQSKHSLFGASKVSADILVQEYGRYFHMPTCCLRGGCLTGPAHCGVELHGFLSYLVRCNLERKRYVVYGYKGKQVRDNIHAADVVQLVDRFFRDPKRAAVYNIGGGKSNSISILEAFTLVEGITGLEMDYEYRDSPREGDHICYYSDLARIQSDYSDWKVTMDIRSTVEELLEGWLSRLDRHCLEQSPAIQSRNARTM